MFLVGNQEDVLEIVENRAVMTVLILEGMTVIWAGIVAEGMKGSRQLQGVFWK